MTSRMILLFVAFIALCFAQSKPANPFQTTFEGKIFKNKAFTANFTVTNVDDKGAKLSVTLEEDTVICIVVKTWGLPNYTGFTADNCAYWVNATKPKSTPGLGTNSTDRTIEIQLGDSNFGLLSTDYTIGFYYASPANVEKNETSISATLSGSQCSVGLYFNPKGGVNKCEPAKTVKSLGSEFSTLFPAQTPDVPQYWQFQAPAEIGSITVAAKNPAVPVDIYLRYMGTPYPGQSDSKGRNTATMDYPRPGLWLIAVSTPQTKASQVAFTISGMDCSKSNLTGGPACKVPYKMAENNFYLTTFPKVYTFYKFVATPAQGLRVSITTASQKEIPMMFASRGQLPTADSHDISNCNGGYCEEVKSIHRTVTKDEIWYVGIVALPTVVNTTAGVWWNTTCVTGCDQGTRGSCLDSGFCRCDPSFIGVDCMTSDGLAPQYIVLIIIASLVVASAFIGFVAWAYMRQKRAHYDKI